MTSGLWSVLRSFLDVPDSIEPDAAGRDASSTPRLRRVLILGPSLDSLGGVSGVIRVLLGQNTVGGYDLRLLSTYTDGSRGRKIAVAFRAITSFIGALVTGSVDVVHVHFAARASFWRKSLFILLARLFGTPVVGHAHSGLFPRFYREAGWLRQWYIRLVLNSLDRLIVLSDEWAEFYRPLYHRSEPAIISNPVDVPDDIDPYAATHAERDGPVMLTLGRMCWGKGTYDLLDVIPEVLERVPNARFRFGGDGEIEEVRRRIADKPWRDRVELLGWVAGAEKDRMLRETDVFVLPSYAEGLPLCILEAMAYGHPVVATPVGGIPQVVRDGETGMLIQAGDKEALRDCILRLLADRATARRMGDAGRRLVLERCDPRQVQLRLASLYDEIVRRR